MNQVAEVKGDLFSAEPEWGLAHTVSACLKMGAGIAPLFKTRYGQVPELKAQNPQIGNVCVLYKNIENRPAVYYLITKKFFYQKPTYASVEQSLVAMRDDLSRNKITKIAMPHIGCGLDKLDWAKVLAIIQSVFLKTPEVQVRIYVL
jgi:O-acetyl-ADP-ribose deacetylase (regulator of RNase III)